jgi:hypothetical protein
MSRRRAQCQVNCVRPVVGRDPRRRRTAGGRRVDDAATDALGDDDDGACVHDAILAVKIDQKK